MRSSCEAIRATRPIFLAKRSGKSNGGSEPPQMGAQGARSQLSTIVFDCHHFATKISFKKGPKRVALSPHLRAPSWTGLRNTEIVRETPFFKVAHLQSEFCTKDFFRATNFLTKNAPKFSPKFFEPLFCGSEKSPENSLHISH